jgi:hypothetical protein
MRHPPDLRPLPLRLLAALGAVLLLAGTVDLHPEAVHAEGVGGDGLVYTCADGTGDALHVEAARAEEREHCPACLQRLQGRAADTSAPAALAARVPARTVPPAADPALTPAHPRLQRARGPPVLS